MKEATGELNMTVVTLIAVAAMGALFYFVVWPLVQQMVVTQTCKTYGADYSAVRTAKSVQDSDANSGAKVGDWQCCDKDGLNCIDVQTDAKQQQNNGS